MSAIAEPRLPHWDLTAAFPSLSSSEFEKGFASLCKNIAELEESVASLPDPKSPQAIHALESLIERYNDIRFQARLLRAYIGGHVSVNSRDAAAQAKYSEFELATVSLVKLDGQIAAWIGGLDLENVLDQSELAREHEYALRTYEVRARHLMSEGEEALLAELAPSHAMAWEKLQANMTSQMVAHVKGQAEPIGISVVRNMAYHPEREVRKSAYEAELKAFKANEVPLAAAMNSIKAFVNVSCRRRLWPSPLDEAIFYANIDRESLDAMMGAAREAFPQFRRYWNAKAKALGLSKLAWYDMFAPVGKTSRRWSYQEACDFVATQFHKFSDKMGSFAERCFRENWVDAEPRLGKVDGAFCMPFVNDESRVLMNFTGSYGNVSTLAHELGHGYHNLNLFGRTYLQRETPMTLAETASIFCELVILNAALREASDDEKLALIESSLMRSGQTVVDISSRFVFESRVFEGSLDRELSPEELCDAMLHAQKETYGSGLDENQLHPYMWAAKPHYYSTESFYNYPYMFGLLFSTGLYAIYEQDPNAFRGKYDDLLSSTGLSDAATLTARFGIDIRSIDFWRDSLKIIEREIDMFEKLI